VSTGRSLKAVEPEAGSSTDPLDFLFVQRALDLNGHAFTFRELSVAESDECIDKSRRPDDTIDGRLNMRLLISKSSVEPKLKIDDIAKMPNRVYIKIAEFVNDLNSIDDAEAADKDEGEGNA
jgi:hypothetical protein